MVDGLSGLIHVTDKTHFLFSFIDSLYSFKKSQLIKLKGIGFEMGE